MVREVQRPTDEQLDAAAAVVAEHLAPTPVVALRVERGTLWCKLETLQTVGSFKVRGALAAVAAARAADPDGQVVTCSAGNHGLGIAYAAKLLGVHATVVVPETASPVKVAKLRGYPIELVQHGERYGDAQDYALAFAARTGARFISPYNDPDVVAGQSTVGAELVDQVPGMTHLLVPVGGGGLISGIGLALRHRGSRVTILGLQAARDAALVASLRAGRVVDVDGTPTIADGLAGAIEQGAITFELIRELGIELVALDEADIRAAVRRAAVQHGLVLEGSAAVALAAADLGLVPFDEGEVAMVATGRNLTGPLLAELLAEAG